MQINKEVSVGHLIQVGIIALSAIIFFVGLGNDIGNVDKTLAKVVELQESCDDRLIMLEQFEVEVRTRWEYGDNGRLNQKLQ